MKNNKIYSKPKNGFCGAQNKPTNKDKIKNILAWILIALIGFCVIGSTLGTIAFTKTVKADSNLTFFNGSNVFIPATSFSKSGINKGGSVLLYGDYYGGHYTDNPRIESYAEPQRFSLESNKFFTYYTPYKEIDSSSYLGFNFSMQDIINTDGSISTNLAFFSIHTIRRNESLLKPYYAGATNTYLNMSSELTWRYPEVGGQSNRDWETTLTDAGSYLFAYSTVTDHSLDTNYTDTGNTLCLLRITKTENFRSNIYKIEYGRNLNRYGSAGSEPFYNTIQGVNGKYYKYHYYLAYNYIRYYNTETQYLEFAVPVYYDPNVTNFDYDAFHFQNRTYYLSNSGGGIDQSTIDRYLQQGADNFKDNYIGSEAMKMKAEQLWKNDWILDYKQSNKFYQDAYNEYYSTWYSLGINDGKAFADNEIYWQGYGDGANAASNATFLSVVTAPIDGVITAIFGNGQAGKGLLNFELLGINMSSFYTGLITCALILFVVKFISSRG